MKDQEKLVLILWDHFNFYFNTRDVYPHQPHPHFILLWTMTDRSCDMAYVGTRWKHCFRSWTSKYSTSCLFCESTLGEQDGLVTLVIYSVSAQLIYAPHEGTLHITLALSCTKQKWDSKSIILWRLCMPSTYSFWFMISKFWDVAPMILPPQ